MRFVFRWAARLLLLGVVALCVFWVFGPREPVDFDVAIGPVPDAAGIDAYLSETEAAFPDIVDGTQKRVIWAGQAGQKTPVSVVYIHGFSATSEEIRPVPDMLAEGLGANLVFTRLRGHGRTGAAMSEATVANWMQDTLEALEIGRAVGGRVIVLSTSTGGTLMAAAALREDAMQDVAGAIFVSPNFAVQSPAAVILTWPAVRWWGPLIAGAERSFEALNEGHEQFWTTRYETVALLPMAALVKAVDGLDLSLVTVPALFVISDQDKVVSPEKTRSVAQEWGGASDLEVLRMGAGDDPFHHVIAGRILSPGQNEAVSARMIEWARGVLGD